MTARVRLLMSFLFTFALVGGGALTWGVRTGQLTIFGDAPATISANLIVTSPIDLQKGIDAGDHQLTVTPTGVGLIDGATTGTAIFTLGQRDIVAIDRVVPILADPLPDTSSITFAFAGSPDGVSFNDFSPAQLVTTNSADTTGVPIPLDFLIPAHSRFVRIQLMLNRTDSTEQPILAGFTINYSQLAPNTTGASDETVLVNGSPSNTTASAPLPGRPASLVVTGNGTWLIVLFGICFIGNWLIWSRRRFKGGNARTLSG